MADAVEVIGLRELNAAFAQTDKVTRAAIRAEYRTVARPVQQAAHVLAYSRISNMALSPSWAGMRVGVTRSMVYVAPQKRGTKNRRAKRPNLAGLLATRALEPALERHRAEVEERFERMLDRVCDDFNHQGGLI